MGKEQDLLEAARSGNAAIIEKLLSQRNRWPLPLPLPQLTNNIRKGVHVNCQDANGETPLHHAALNGHRDVVELLLKLQASANIPDQKGCYPLHLAAWRGNADICRILLCHGPSIAKVNAQNLEGDTALHSAAQYGHTAVVGFLLQNGADPNVTNKKSETALDLAAQYCRLDTIRLLLRSVQQNPAQSRVADRSPLHLAARHGHPAVITVLLDAGFDINRKTEEGSALHEAALYSRLEVVKLLLERGIDLSIVDRSGKTALEVVSEQKNHISIEIQKLIEQLLDVTEPTYDQLPVPRCVILHSVDSNSVNSATSRDSNCVFDFPQSTEEESLYDCPPAQLRAVIPSVDHLSASSLSLTDEPLPPGTPRKPPRRKLLQSCMMVKGDSTEKLDKRDVGGVLPPVPSDIELDLHKTGITNTVDATPQNLVTHEGSGSTVLLDASRSLQNNNDIPPVTVATVAATVDNPVAYASQNGGIPQQQQHNAGGISVGNSHHQIAVDNDVANNNSSASVGIVESNANVSHINDRPSRATVFEPSVRPPGLDLTSKRLSCPVAPLSPTNYEQPPTPEHPPPSPMTAILGIQEKINPQDRRRSRDMETITEQEYLGGATVAMDTATKASEGPAADAALDAKQKSRSEESVAAGSDFNPFIGLLKGSVVGGGHGLRKAKSQRCDSKCPPPSVNKRKSVPCPRSNFSAVFDEPEQPTGSDVTHRARGSRPADARLSCVEKSVSTSVDETEEWAKIGDILTSCGGILKRPSIDYKDRRWLLASVRALSADSSVQSIRDWLVDVGLPQYENDLIANGYDDMRFMGRDVLDEADLIEVGITDTEHRARILQSSSNLPAVQSTACVLLKDWLESLHLMEYADTFIRHGFNDVDRMRRIWEVELTTILDIARLGHRKRIMASLRSSTAASAGDDVDVTEPRQSVSRCGRKDSLAAISCDEAGNTGDRSPQQVWHHRPESLIKGCYNYAAQYLGSTLVGELVGTDSTKASICQLKKSTGNISKVPRIILSVSYRGVKFIDGSSKKVICEHEIDNIFCACQDGDDLTVFAYITRDLSADKEKHYCHVFRVDNTDLATEVILTLGEAFEVAYQFALQENGGTEPGSVVAAASSNTSHNDVANNQAAVGATHSTSHKQVCAGSYSTVI